MIQAAKLVVSQLTLRCLSMIFFFGVIQEEFYSPTRQVVVVDNRLEKIKLKRMALGNLRAVKSSLDCELAWRFARLLSRSSVVVPIESFSIDKLYFFYCTHTRSSVILDDFQSSLNEAVGMFHLKISRPAAGPSSEGGGG